MLRGQLISFVSPGVSLGPQTAFESSDLNTFREECSDHSNFDLLENVFPLPSFSWGHGHGFIEGDNFMVQLGRHAVI